MDDSDDTNFAERFKNEARAMAKLNHPGIVSVFDSGATTDGLLYIVMEFVEGTDVSRMIARQGRLPAEQRHGDHRTRLRRAAIRPRARHHPPRHQTGQHHGRLRWRGEGGGLWPRQNDASGESGLTRSGMAMGTLHYMAPRR
jgi:hypothetical protein